MVTLDEGNQEARHLQSFRLALEVEIEVAGHAHHNEFDQRSHRGRELEADVLSIEGLRIDLDVGPVNRAVETFCSSVEASVVTAFMNPD